jgi:hypothetical protein
MEPFVLRYAKRQKRQNSKEIPPMLYDTNAEAMVFTRSGETELVIDDPTVSMATGTTDTLSSPDHSTDEPTDR